MNLSHHFLISTPQMRESIFSDAVIYLCKHDDEGAFGLVVNKPSPMRVSELLESLEVKSPALPQEKDSVLFGGPVQAEQVFILHQPLGHFGATLNVGKDEIGVTTSRDILAAISSADAPRRMQFTIGYCGWAPGQLEREIADNAWVTIAADEQILFELPPDERLAGAARRLGFDWGSLTGVSGRA